MVTDPDPAERHVLLLPVRRLLQPGVQGCQEGGQVDRWQGNAKWKREDGLVSMDTRQEPGSAEDACESPSAFRSLERRRSVATVSEADSNEQTGCAPLRNQGNLHQRSYPTLEKPRDRRPCWRPGQEERWDICSTRIDHSTNTASNRQSPAMLLTVLAN